MELTGSKIVISCLNNSFAVRLNGEHLCDFNSQPRFPRREPQVNHWHSIQQSAQENDRRSAQKAAAYEARAVKSAQKKVKLAQKLDDNSMLIACLRFYVEELRANRIFNFEEMFEKHRKTIRKVRHYRAAARRILGIGSSQRTKSFRLLKIGVLGFIGYWD